MMYRQAREMESHGGYSEALSKLKKVLMIAPHFARACEEMGNCFFMLGRYREALAAYNKAIVMDPSCNDVIIKMDMTLKKIETSLAGSRFRT